MSNNLGDFDTSAVVYGKFTTFRPSTGAAFTLGGTPALSVYKDDSLTQSTTGVTLTADFDSVTGLNHFTIDTSADGTFYSAGSFFDIVITTGTVDSVSVVGAVVGSFTLRKTSALKPTTAARTLDVSASGEAGVDWANVGSPTTAVDLSNTTIKTTQKVDVDTIKTNPVVNGGTITFPSNATLASTTGAVGSVTGAVGSVTGAVGSVTGNVGGNVTGSVGSVVGNVGGNVVGSVASVTGNVGGNLVGSIGDFTATAVNTFLDLASAIETGLTMRNALRLIASTTGGKIGDAGTTTNTFRNAVADTKNRVTATVDTSGNRTAITYDFT